MLKQLQKLRRESDEKGFTIIEVLIVLAIAGLIMVVVFLAVPNLQKSQRNNGRKTDANNALSALSDYISNNGGALPTANCTGATACSMSSLKFSQFDPTTLSFVVQGSISTLPATTAMTPSSIYLVGGAVCPSASSAPTATGAQARQIAVYYGIEGDVKSQCISQ